MCLIEDIREDLKKTPPDTEKIHLRTNSLLYLLTRLLAVSMGISDFDKLYSDIPVSIFHTNPRFKGLLDERASAILDSEEFIREKYIINAKRLSSRKKIRNNQQSFQNPGMLPVHCFNFPYF